MTPAYKLNVKQFIRQFCVDCANGTSRDTELDGITPYTVQGTVKSCATDGRLEVLCACSDDDGDGIGETSYKKLVYIGQDGSVTFLANYDRTLTNKYTPISPVDCNVPGDNLVAARARYKTISNVGTWVLGADSALPTSSVSVAVVSVGNVATPPTVTDAGGTYPLFYGQALSWSTQFSRDVSGLRPPLVFTSNLGDSLAVAWVEEVT